MQTSPGTVIDSGTWNLQRRAFRFFLASSAVSTSLGSLNSSDDAIAILNLSAADIWLEDEMYSQRWGRYLYQAVGEVVSPRAASQVA